MKRSILLLSFLGSSVAAFGQLGEVSLSFGKATPSNKSLGVDTNGVAYDVASNFRFDIRMTINSWRFFGHEFGYGYTRSHINANGSNAAPMGIHMGFYDFLAYATSEGSRIRPFGAGGVHFASFSPPGTSVSYGNTITKFGFNFGGGLKVRLTDMFMGRVDVRDYVQGKPDLSYLGILNESGWLRLLTVTAGLAFVF